MTTTCTRRIQFCAGHRLKDHEGKCAHLHGHNYVVLLTAEGATDTLGRVIDFSVLKERVGGWIDEHWDHGFIYFDKDSTVRVVLDCLPGQKRFPLPYNPTAENLARYLMETICPQVLGDTGVRVSAVRVWETENCYAEVCA